MQAGTRVRVKDHEAAHPSLRGAEGEVLWTSLKDLIVMVKLDKVVENAPPSHYGPRFHSVAIRALEEVKE